MTHNDTVFRYWTIKSCVSVTATHWQSHSREKKTMFGELYFNTTRPSVRPYVRCRLQVAKMRMKTKIKPKNQTQTLAKTREIKLKNSQIKPQKSELKKKLTMKNYIKITTRNHKKNHKKKKNRNLVHPHLRWPAAR